MLTEKVQAFPSEAPSDHQILVILAKVSDIDEPEESLYFDWLTRAEIQRVRSFRDLTASRCSLLGRAMVKAVAAQWLKTSPQDVCITYLESGKPVLQEATSNQWHFSVTHHQDCVAVAFANAPLGIDLETPQKQDRIKLARRYFLPEESHHLASLEGSERSEYFTWLWTLKEAEVKRCGSALAHVMGKAGFKIAPPRIYATDASQAISYYLYRSSDQALLSLACSTLSVSVPECFLGRPYTGYQRTSLDLVAKT
ncbi:4'-phosphopantetheinyl transferase family protein [Hahella ganghwensis]|uniref:4'-phosphopantetheinyl transferase family protein n=1 Tax=Hahella ganghwensis TaxID=286420 RepID=UPI00037124E2|nr:4'-phosphopantetheinyl transferase superfamily protein [Hahella ganghwensis]